MRDVTPERNYEALIGTWMAIAIIVDLLARRGVVPGSEVADLLSAAEAKREGAKGEAPFREIRLAIGFVRDFPAEVFANNDHLERRGQSAV